MLSLLCAVCFSHAMSWILLIAINGSNGRVSALCGRQSDQAGRSSGTDRLSTIKCGLCSDEQTFKFAVQGAKGNTLDDPMARETVSWPVVSRMELILCVCSMISVWLLLSWFVLRWSWCYSTKEWTEKNEDAHSDYSHVKRVFGLNWIDDDWSIILLRQMKVQCCISLTRGGAISDRGWPFRMRVQPRLVFFLFVFVLNGNFSLHGFWLEHGIRDEDVSCTIKVFFPLN